VTIPANDTILSETWRLGGTVRWRLWQDEAVAYNGRTGDTHHFADFAAWTFARLAAGPARGADLARAAADSVELRSGSDPGDTVERTLALLARLELIERAA
jgi:PqqD family protein of HPr-rel-A system